MRKSVQLRIFAMVLFALLVSAATAHAQATRTWVSGVGDDANPCSRTAPCKTFAGAISKTAVCGEIDVLDPGGFGALTITKCISIEAEGLIAGVLVSGTNGFVVAAGAGDVMIRGLTFEGLGTGLNGIRVTSAGKVYIENCEINNFTGFGIDFEPSATGTQLFVTNTTVRNNGNFGASTGGGILTAPSPVVVVLGSLNNVRIEGNVSGLVNKDGGNITIQNSVSAGNKLAGFSSASTGATGTALFLDHVNSMNNQTGVVVGAVAVVRMADTSITGNGTGVSVTGGGQAFGFGSSNIAGNGTDISPANGVTTIAAH